jgi:tetratricopeptide (TPR) repeat protein
MDEMVDGARALALADEAFDRFDIDAVVAHLSTAVRTFTADGDIRQAALASTRLGDAMANGLGNLPAARAWFARATRLLADEPPCVEQGWVAVAEMGCEVADPDELLAAAELALDRARRFGDVELETKALADGGLAHVQLGRIEAGMAMLDEAMALACGPASHSAPVAASVCSFFTACYHVADFERADTWADLLRRQGLIGPAPGPPIYLSSHCDAVHATMLVELGRWHDAEDVLEQARAAFGRVMPFPAWHPEIALADLRIRQGRIDDAEALLLGKDQYVQALLPAARLHLARGDHDLACAAAHRGLRGLRDDRLRAAELLTVVVEAELARGDVAAADAACAELAARTSGVDVPALAARAACARARALATVGDHAGAVAVLERALDALDPQRLPFARATTLVALARARRGTGDAVGASLDARAAGELVAALDVVLTPADRTVLDELIGGRPDRPPDPGVLARDGAWWTVACEGTTARLPDTKGLRYLAALLADPGRERHALDLVDHVEGVARDLDRRVLGDAGPALDAAARAAYRRRIEELRGEIDDAVDRGDDDAAAAANEELEQLVRQLARAFGIDGRARRDGSVVERARLNVTRALRAATARLAAAVPGAGDIDGALRTGTYCAYEPVDGDRIWIVQSGLNRPAPD